MEVEEYLCGASGPGEEEESDDQDEVNSKSSFNMLGGQQVTPEKQRPEKQKDSSDSLLALSGAPSTLGGSAPSPAPSKPGKKGEEKRRCRTCAKMQTTSDWPLNCPHCRLCKRAIDNLRNASKMQKQDDWWKETHGDEKKLRKVIEKYNERCPPAPEKKRSKMFFSIVQYIETFKASSSVLHDDEGEMMHKDKFISWSKSVDNPDGIFTDAQADAKWEELRAGPLTDEKGPITQPDRCRVKTKDRVIFRTGFEHAKEQRCQQNKDEKKATMDSVEIGRRSLLRDHEKGIGRNGEEADFSAIGQAMLGTAMGSSGTGTSAFAGPGVYVPNVSDLGEELAEEAEAKASLAAAKKGKRAAQPQEGESDDDEGKEEEPSEKKAAKTAWFDEGSINQAKRKQQTADESLRVLMGKVEADASEALHAAGDDVRYEREVATLKFRFKFLTAALSADTSILPELLQTTKNKERQRPPSEDWLSLVRLQEIQVATEKVFLECSEQAQTRDDVDRRVKGLVNRRVPLTKLSKSVAKATKDLLAAAKSRKRTEEQEAKKNKAAGGGSGPGTPAGGSAPRTKKLKINGSQAVRKPVFEASRGIATEIASTAEHGSPELSELQFPCIVPYAAALKELQAGLFAHAQRHNAHTHARLLARVGNKCTARHDLKYACPCAGRCQREGRPGGVAEGLAHVAHAGFCRKGSAEDRSASRRRGP